MTIRMYMLNPTIIFAARVNQASFIYPLTSVTFDGVTTGAFGDIISGMTVLFGSSAGADDLGRQRVRAAATSVTLPIGRSSQGTRDGEVDLTDNCYITVLDDYRVWAKIPYIDGDELHYKDEIAWTDETTDIPPVANAGAAVFATIDGSDIITVDFDSANSYAVADGATIASYLWDVDDGSITVGTSASSAITATFPAGFRWVKLTVTDDNGKSHTCKVPVFARDPDGDACIDIFQIASHRITPDGQQMSVRVLESISTATYPDGTLVMLADGEPSSAADRSNLLFMGWHQSDPADVGAERTAVLKETHLSLADVAGRLDTLPSFPFSVVAADTPDKWSQMTTPNIDKFLHYLLHWHSTAIDVADFIWSGTGSSYAFAVLGTEGASLWDNAKRKTGMMAPDYRLTCNTLGQLRMIVDPMLQDTGDRTATVQATLTEADFSDLRYEHMRNPRFHWLRSGLVISSNAFPPTAVLSRSPGDSPGQGENEVEYYEQIGASQSVSNAVGGHRYARMNAPESPFRIVFAEGADKSIEPADMTWVRLTITSTSATQRGLTFTNERGLPLELNIRYSHARTGLTKTVEMLWERETSGKPGASYVPYADPQLPTEDDNWWGEPNYDPPVADAFGGDMGWYVAWFGDDEVYRSKDFPNAEPTWENIDTGLQGVVTKVFDIQYVHNTSTDNVAAWALCNDGMYYCADIMTTTPTWTQKLSNATVQAADTQPVVGATVCANFATWDSDPLFCFVATGYDSTAAGDSSNLDTKSGFGMWHTHDAGDTWTNVDLSATFSFSSLGKDRSYGLTTLYASEMYRDTDGIIYCARAAQPIASSHQMAIFKSADQGHTWTKAATTYSYYNNWRDFTLIHPYPARTDPCYFIAGAFGATDRNNVFKSTDEFETTSIVLSPSTLAGCGGVHQGQRVNSKPDDVNHVLFWGRDNTGSGNDIVVESDDAGSTWSIVYSGSTNGANSVQIVSTYSGCSYSPPNGWPGNGNEWVGVLMRTGGSGLIDDYVGIIKTSDGFATGMSEDKTGNLSTLRSSYPSSGVSGGFALPKVGGNT